MSQIDDQKDPMLSLKKLLEGHKVNLIATTEGISPLVNSVLLLGCTLGSFIPQVFIEKVNLSDIGIDWDVKAVFKEGPSNKHYWFLWSEIMLKAEFKDEKGVLRKLFFDGSLWTVPQVDLLKMEREKVKLRKLQEALNDPKALKELAKERMSK